MKIAPIALLSVALVGGMAGGAVVWSTGGNSSGSSVTVHHVDDTVATDAPIMDPTTAPSTAPTSAPVAAPTAAPIASAPASTSSTAPTHHRRSTSTTGTSTNTATTGGTTVTTPEQTDPPAAPVTCTYDGQTYSVGDRIYGPADQYGNRMSWVCSPDGTLGQTSHSVKLPETCTPGETYTAPWGAEYVCSTPSSPTQTSGKWSGPGL